MILRDILEGVGLHSTHALAVHQHLGYGVALIRGDGEGLIPSVTDGGPAGGRDGAVRAGRCLNGVVGVVPTAAAAGLVIQLNGAGQRRVVGVGGSEEPLVGGIGRHSGGTGQDIACVIHPHQRAGIGVQRAAGNGQAGVCQRLAAGGDSGVLGCAGGGRSGDGDLHLCAGRFVEACIRRLGDLYLYGTNLDGSQLAGGVNGCLAGAVGHSVGHSPGAGAAGGAQLQGLAIDHGGSAGNAQCLLIVLFCQGDSQGDGEILVVVAGGFQGDGDLVTRLAAGDSIGQQTAVRREILLGKRSLRAVADAVFAVIAPRLPGGNLRPVRRVGVIRGVRVLLLQLDRFEAAAIRLVHHDFKPDVLHCVVVFGVLRSELCLEGLGGSRSAAHRFAAIRPTPAVRQRHIRQRLTVFCRQVGGLCVGRCCLRYHKFTMHSFKSVVVIRITNAGVHTVGTGVQRGRILNIPRLNRAVARRGITVGHLSIRVTSPVCQGRCAGRLTVSIACHADLAVLLSLFDSDIRSSRNR